MSLVTETAPRAEAAASAEAPIYDPKMMAIGAAAMCAFYVCVRIYEQYFGWYAGPEFVLS